MNTLSQNQILLVHGGSIHNAVGSAMFSLIGAAVGFVTGPYFMPLVHTTSDSYRAEITNYIIDSKAGDYGIHTLPDAIGALVGIYVGGLLGGALGAAIS